MDPTTAIQATQLAGTVHHDFSVWGLFLQADIIVKSVMIILAASSIWSWAIIFDKWITYKSLHIKAGRFETSFWSGEALEKLYKKIQAKPTDPLARVFCAGMHEWKLSAETGNIDGLQAGLQQRIDRSMAMSINREISLLERYMTFLFNC